MITFQDPSSTRIVFNYRDNQVQRYEIKDQNGSCVGCFHIIGKSNGAVELFFSHTRQTLILNDISTNGEKCYVEQMQ